MDCRKLALGLAAGASLAWIGCGGDPPGTVLFPERDFVCEEGASPPCATTREAHTEADRKAVPGDSLGGRSFTFIINELKIPAPENGQAVGFNLDGMDSGDGTAGETCQDLTEDYRSALDPDHVGVDNALPTVLTSLGGALGGGFDVDMELAEQLAEGSLLLLLQLGGVDDLSYDQEVTMQLALGALPAGATLQLDDSGRIAPGQQFDIAMNLGPQVTGDIFDGRVAARAEQLPLMLEIEGNNITLVIRNLQVRFNLAEDGLSNGVIGGVLTLDDLITAALEVPELRSFCCTAEPCTDCPVARGLIGPNADVGPSESDPASCEAISTGIQFAATTASTGS